MIKLFRKNVVEILATVNGMAWFGVSMFFLYQKNIQSMLLTTILTVVWLVFSYVVKLSRQISEYFPDILVGEDEFTPLDDTYYFSCWRCPKCGNDVSVTMESLEKGAPVCKKCSIPLTYITLIRRRNS